MGRPLRIEYPGALYHITSRGNERRIVFVDDEDRMRFLDTLHDYHDRFRIRVHAFVLMDNHYHLVLETPRGNLVKVMQGLNSGYTGYFNRKYQRSGHLFQGRYKAILVDKKGYLVELTRYVHLNPVRAQMADTPEVYPWSSYPGYVLKSKARDWIEYGWVLGRFSHDLAAARRRYRKYVRAGSSISPLENAYGQLVLGGEAFIAQTRARLKGAVPADLIAYKRLQTSAKPQAIIQAVAKAFALKAAAVTGPGRRRENLARNAAMYLLKHHAGMGNAEIGEMFGGLHFSGVSKTTTRFAAQLKQDKKLAAVINRLSSRIKA